MRDDFTKTDKEVLAKRVGFKCSNPNCRKVTIGPSTDELKTINVGVAAHIKAAATGGKRYDQTQTNEERSSIENGIWLCQTCAKLIDSDEHKYTHDLLINWKIVSENAAALDVVNPPQSEPANIFVTAINPVQSQVAHTIINNKPPQRVISHDQEQDLSYLLKQIPKETCMVLIPVGDQEAGNFGKQIVSILQNIGWSISEYWVQSYGQSQDGIRISIPSHSNITLEYLGGWFRDNGFRIVAYNNDKNSNQNQIWIGSNLN